MSFTVSVFANFNDSILYKTITFVSCAHVFETAQAKVTMVHIFSIRNS